MTKSAVRPRGEYRKTARVREEVLDAAFAVFARTGFTSATVSEIAREVGMSQPGLLHHFPNKQAMLEAVFERRDGTAQDILGGRRDVEFLRGLLEISRRNTGQADLIRLYTVIAAEATAPDHPMHEHFKQRYEMILRETTRAFAEAGELGLLRPGVDPGKAAEALIAVTEGLQILWLNDFDVDMVADTKRFMEGYLTVTLD